MTRNRALLLMVASLLLATLLRTSQLTEIPPGLHYDEAANAILAGDIGLRGQLPIFITSYTGKEVLFFYAAGALMRLVGPSVFTLRLAAALLGILTIAATYWLGRELLADRRVAVIAAGLLAVSFWHVVFSRLGFRAVSQPLLQALAVAALFRGMKNERQWRWFVLAGALLGLTAYTYLAARIFPIPLGLALLPFLFGQGRQRTRWARVTGTVFVALLVLAPLLYTFWLNPDAFWVRIQQVGGLEAAGRSGLDSYLSTFIRSLGMFFLVGDPYWRFNIPGRPLFNWLWGGLLVAGWIVALWRWRRWWYDWQKSAVLLLLIVPFAMILPTALAVEEIVPSNLRAIGLIPFIFYLPAQGLVTLLEQVFDLVRRPGEQVTAFLRYLNVLEGYDVNYAFVVLLILLLGAAETTRAYFQEYGQRSDLFYDSDADLVAVAQYLNQDAPQEPVTYVAAEHYRHPTLAFLADDYDELKWLPGSAALVFPPQGSALYVFPRNSPAPAWMEPYLQEAQQASGPAGPDEEALFQAFQLSQMPDLAGIPENEVQANFGNVLDVIGYGVDAAPSGEALPLTVYWQVNGAADRPLRLFAHLEDAWGHRWSQDEPVAYPAEQWQVGERVVQRVNVPVPDGTPPGSFRLRFGFFDEETGERLPRLDSEGRYAGDALVVGNAAITVGEQPPNPPQAPRGTPRVVRPGLQLLGYSRNDDAAPTGTRLPLALWWWATERQPPLTVRLELLRDDSTGIILANSKPVHGTHPFQQWPANHFVRDRIDPQIPLDLEPGDYRLHLRVLEEQGDTVFTSSLGVVSVVATERRFTAPDVEHPLAADFAGEIALLGYDLQESGSNQVNLRLVWQALSVPADDYTVFVHLLYPDGTCCAWQADTMPASGQYPSGRWIPGEVVVDEYTISIPDQADPGRYALEVGLYIAETGQRLRVTLPGTPESDAIMLRPIDVP